MTLKTFNYSLGQKGFEINFIGKKWSLRIASRQFALWKNYPLHKEIFNFCRWKKSKNEPVTNQ